MFIISQYLLKKSKLIPDIVTISTYSSVIGLIIYASLYIYFLIYNKEILPFFNKIIIYIVGIDLLLSIIYFYKLKNENENETCLNKISYQVIGADKSQNYDDDDTLLSESESDECDYTENDESDIESNEKDDEDYDIIEDKTQSNNNENVFQQPNSENEASIKNPQSDQVLEIVQDDCIKQDLNTNENFENTNKIQENNKLLNNLNILTGNNEILFPLIKTQINDTKDVINNVNEIQSIDTNITDTQKVKIKRKRRTKKEIEQDLLLQKQKQESKTIQETTINSSI